MMYFKCETHTFVYILAEAIKCHCLSYSSKCYFNKMMLAKHASLATSSINCELTYFTLRMRVYHIVILYTQRRVQPDNVMLQYKLLAAILSAVCSVIQQYVLLSCG